MNKTVLVLDDDALFRAMVTPALEARGLRVVPAANRAQATELLAAERPDVLVVDGLLPDGSGVDWIADQRKKGVTLPVVFISAFWRDTATAKKLINEHQVGTVLHKPIAPDAFAQKVESELAKHAPAEEQTAADDVDVSISIESQTEFQPRELTFLQKDAARTLTQKTRELTDAINKAQLRYDKDAITEARTRSQKLVTLASSCDLTEFAVPAAKLEQTLKALQSNPRDPKLWGTAMDALADAVRLGKKAAEPTTEEAPRPKRLLVVDPEPSTLHHLRALTPRSVCELITATGRVEATKLAKKTTPDAALIDADLEHTLGGFDLAHLLRANPGCEMMKLGFMGPRQTPQHKQAAAEVDSTAFLSKPFARDAVAHAVTQLVGVTFPARARVMVVEMDREVREELSFSLVRHGMEPLSIKPEFSWLGQVAALLPDALILDPDQQNGAGFKLLQAVRALPRWADLPIVAVSASPASRMASLEAGADGALRKPADHDEVMAVVRRQLERTLAARERTDRDLLTGLPGRHAFLETLARRLADARRYNRTLAVCLLRVDGLEAANKLGVEVGDELLSRVSGLFSKRFRAEDERARWTGATFAICFQGANSSNVQKVLARLKADTAKLTLSKPDIPTGFTAGVAAMPFDGTTIAELVLSASGRLAEARAQIAKKPPPLPRFA